MEGNKSFTASAVNGEKKKIKEDIRFFLEGHFVVTCDDEKTFFSSHLKISFVFSFLNISHF
jgi:hypothetical protein